MSSCDPVDLSNCDREPIHIPGSIQPHGAMLVCNRAGDRLLYASRNTADITGYEGDLIHGTVISDILGQQAAHDLRNAAAKASRPGAAGVVLGIVFPGVSGSLDATIHRHDDKTFIEIEPCVDDGRSARNALDLTRELIQRISLEQDLDAMARAGARLARAMLGYDRVMVYRFLHNGAGRVIAEAKAPHLGSFMGQHFPASDIPAQARRLYLVNPIRMISDAGYEPIPLAPPLNAGEKPVDMSFAQLRSVSPIHCEYLRNMGVAASLSISIIVDGQLWGLIACHHDSPKVTPMPLRIAAELFGHYFSLQIGAAERRASMLAAADARAQLDAIVSGLSVEGAIIERLAEHLPAFARLIECNGVALWMDNIWYGLGATPDREYARDLVHAARGEERRAIWATQEIRASFPLPDTGIAGVLAIPLSLTFDDYLFFFRNEEAHTVKWAGEPSKTPDKDGRLTPRGSFETWREDVKGRSMPWTAADLSVAEAVRTYLRDVILKQNELSAEERARTEQRRRILNDELNHRVKNIISLVKSIALQTGAAAATVSDYTASLEGRLLALANAHDQSLGGGGGGSIASLIDTEANFHRHEGSPERITISGPGVLLDNRAFGVLSLVIHEMITNAAKYGALSTPGGQLAISWRLKDDGDLELNWSESGGPPVATPKRVGFGTRLIRSSIEYDLRGTADLSFPPSGLVARFVIPAAHIEVGEPSPVEAVHTPSVKGSLEGLSILVVEDQGLIAMDAEETLRKLGAGDVRLAATIGEAEKVLDGFNPDIAVLDFNLGADTSETVADTLLERGIPLVFMTGYSDTLNIPERFRGIPMVRKPVNPESIAKQILHVLSGGSEIIGAE
ncbi:HWE histidine kinase domain-containing protein [Pseudochelatococcus contaminans]|uniref:histidine kinase n=1 Tax=Pseudochelatococcus contaminans TaxID=1538103 RepID=A0A7W5Z2B2_9HYPH|nr:HWE histidine kinase domain-containing protein [Pseudochelatococcus contaminans]MBB3808509.1 light-regulated signal transduction histidine kinase (bacteriophytochrome)/CheY-like chemotaxis protein [Pseudochelatococcus contaminans]